MYIVQLIESQKQISLLVTPSRNDNSKNVFSILCIPQSSKIRKQKSNFRKSNFLKIFEFKKKLFKWIGTERVTKFFFQYTYTIFENYIEHYTQVFDIWFGRCLLKIFILFCEYLIYLSCGIFFRTFQSNTYKYNLKLGPPKN